VARALRTLADAGIEPEFVTTTTGRVTVHLAAAQVDEAVRLLHDEFVSSEAGDTGAHTDNTVATVTDLHQAPKGAA